MFVIFSGAGSEIVGESTGEGIRVGRTFCSGERDALIAIGLTTSATLLRVSRILSSDCWKKIVSNYHKAYFIVYTTKN